MGNPRPDLELVQKEFRAILQSFIKRGKYPVHTDLIAMLGRPESSSRSGLSTSQSRWRKEVLEENGFDADQSMAARQLIRRRGR